MSIQVCGTDYQSPQVVTIVATDCTACKQLYLTDKPRVLFTSTLQRAQAACNEDCDGVSKNHDGDAKNRGKLDSSRVATCSMPYVDSSHVLMLQSNVPVRRVKTRVSLDSVTLSASQRVLSASCFPPFVLGHGRARSA